MFGFQSVNLLSEFAIDAGVAPERIETHITAGGSLEIFKNLHSYSAVSIVSLTRRITYRQGQGNRVSETIVLMTDVTLEDAGETYAADILAKRVIVVNGFLAITPAFFQTYTGNFHEAVVYMFGSESADPNGFASVFARKGIGAFFGHDRALLPTDVWTTLLNGGEAGDVPCIRTGECVLTSSSPAFRLPENCGEADIPQLEISYTWPLTEVDLDTGTEFLGEQVGYDCGPRTRYMSFSGDDTSAGGKETVNVTLQLALDDGAWDATQGISVNLRAGWFIPANGRGPATVSARFADGRGATGIQSINPGAQDDCASTCVGVIRVEASPRLELSLEIGDVCDNNGVLNPTPTPSPEGNGNECEQSYYDLVDFDPLGPGEVTLGASKFASFGDLYTRRMIPLLRQLQYEAFSTANDEFGMTDDDCQSNACDAFRHAYFQFRLATELGAMASTVNGIQEAKDWGDANERTTVNCFSVRIQDLFNNQVGRRLAVENPCPPGNAGCATNRIRRALNDGLLTVDPLNDCGSC